MSANKILGDALKIVRMSPFSDESESPFSE